MAARIRDKRCRWITKENNNPIVRCQREGKILTEHINVAGTQKTKPRFTYTKIVLGKVIPKPCDYYKN